MEEQKVNKIITKILTKYASQFVDGTVENIKKGRRPSIATGNLAKSVSFDIKTTTGMITAEIRLAEYAKWIVDGRKAGKFPPVSAIREWIAVKGLKMKKKPKGLSRDKEVNTLAYLIGRKIYRDGIAPKKLFPKLDIKAMKLEILNELKVYFTVELTTEIKNISTKL